MKCRKPLFNLDSLVIPNNWDYSGVNVIVDLILNEFQDNKVNYLLLYDGSTDVESYIESIDSFIDVLLNQLPVELNEFDKNRIIHLLKLSYYPTNAKIAKESENIPITAIIPEADLQSLHAKNAVKLDTLLSEFFGTNNLLKNYCKNLFKRNIFGVTVILRQGKNSLLVTNQKDLNNNIENYKNQLFKNIYDYLILRGISPELKITQMFYQSGEEKEHKIRPGYGKILDDFYLLILSLSFQDLLESEWVREQTSKNYKSSLLNAVNSYIQLIHFDELLENQTENYLSINDDLDQVIVDNGNGTFDYKYSFGKTGNLVHGWQTEVRDAVKELGSFSRFLIENIPLRNSTSYMTVTDYYTAMLKLKDHILAANFSESDSISNELKFLMEDFHNHPEENLKKIFEIIFTLTGIIKENVKIAFREDSVDYKMNDNDWKVIESLYDFLYNGVDSIYSIETKHVEKTGITSQYPILKSILGAFDSVSLMDYAEVVYDWDDKTYKLRVKQKYYSKKDLYDFIDNINRKTREKGRELIYNSWFDDKTQLHIQIGDLEYTFDFADKDFGILNYKLIFKISAKNNNDDKLISFDLSLTSYFNINLDTISSRQKLIDRINLSDKENLFMALVDYLDFNLGTTFGLDESGLLELNLYLGESRSLNKNLKELFRAAAKVAEVTKLHKGFLELSEISNFKEYLKIHYPFDKLSSNLLDTKTKKTYFYSNYRGEFIYGLSKLDLWVDKLIEARKIISGESTQAVTKNLEGSFIPNISPAFLGREIKQVIADQKSGATQSLLFNQNPDSIKGIVIDTDVKTNSGKIKSVASFSPAELLYHDFINKFVLPFLKNGRMLIQPTVYSDKKKFINYDVDVKELIGNPYRMTNKEFEQLFIKTIGLSYYSLYSKVLQDYYTIYPEAKSLKDINNILRTKSPEEFIKDAQLANVNVMEDIHYRKKINGNLSVNELLQYYIDLYNNETLLHNRLNDEKYKFIRSLSLNRVSFIKSPELEKALTDVGASDWINKNGLMIIAKTKEGDDIIYGNIPDDAIINPLLEKYFYTSTLLSNNLRLALIGSELNHKVKSLAGITNNLETKFDKALLKFIKKYANLKQHLKINFVDIKIAIDEFVPQDENDILFLSDLRRIYEEELYKVETAALSAQLKRTVPVPGTMRYFLLDSLDGIADTMNYAVIEDVPAEVYLFSGKQDKAIDSHDGSAFIDPITSILENNSLQDSEVGTIKKTLWHDFSPEYMSAKLVKYALDTITNQWMRLTENSAIKLYDMFRKMTNSMHWTEDEIPDITSMAYHKNNVKLDFNLDILQGNALYYRIGNESRRIENFDKDEIGYYTEETVVDSDGSLDTSIPKTKYYHFFEGKNHYRIKEGESIPENAHTISSIFELHASLGGIYSQSLMNDGYLHYSEASNYATANFVNNVTIPKVKLTSRPSKTQSNFELPLKKKLINYLINQSAIKNGAENINKSNVYFDESELRYSTISTKRYGILQDSDHEADEARMTEFSQVISSLDANGYYHDYVKEVYEVLGLVALEASQAELEAIKEFNLNREENYDKLYDIVGKTIIANLSLGSKAGLGEAIIASLKKEFNLSVNHANDLKIPFSDPNVYSQILNTISSIINRKSVKREYPGNGMVMAPGYKMCLLWDIDGKTLQFEDLLKQVLVTLNFGESVSEANRRAVKEFLNAKQKEIPIVTLNLAQSFYPSDNVNVYYDDISEPFILELDTMQKYQNFIRDTENCIRGLMLAKGITPIKITGLLKNITVGRDLAPAKITYSYIDEFGQQVDTNVFASWTYQNAYGNPTKEQKQIIQEHLNNIDEGFVYLSEEDKLNDKRTPIFNLKSTPAETILSNIYLSKFGLNYYDSMADILEDNFIKPIKITLSNIYDIVLVKGNNRNLYISIDSSEEKIIKPWKNLIKTSSTQGNLKVNNLYVAEDNQRLFLVGREIILENYSYKDGKFYDENQKLVKGDYIWDGKNVWKLIIFIENAKKSLENGKNFRYFNINRAKLREAFLGGTDNDLDSFIAKLIKDIYNSDSYQLIIPNNELPTNKLEFLGFLFRGLSNQTKENLLLSKLFSDIGGLLHGLSFDKIDKVVLRKKKIGDINYSNYILNYVNSLAHKKYISFLKSQDFTSSRIPAQTLQSFMYMKAVGFTGTSTTQAYVSHFQTYLQGSDYDIDKSYMLGHEFDDNGIYLGWSSLFDYSSIETLHASENLPFPKNRKYQKTNNGVNIDSYALAINSTTGVERINNIVKLLKFLNKQNSLDISYVGDDTILLLINQHESTFISPINKIAVLKNFVSSHIQKQIQGIKNMMAAYSPIEMTDLLKASETTPKALTASGLSVLNPAMIAIMQNLNMVGKNVVGIAANGLKANLMWNYYMNDVVRLPDDNAERLYSKFTFNSSRISGRFDGILQSVEIHGLPDTNWNFENGDLIKQEYDNPLNPSITSDLMESLMISAATDNAKELILDKINSGQLTAKCYLYLITLGFDIKDIVKFMTSPAISFIESMALENVFSGYFNTLEEITKSLIAATINKPKDDDYGRFLEGKTNEEIQEIKADAIEFKNVLAGANEFSNLGKILGINQGVPTTKEKLAGWKRAFKRMIKEREKYLGIIDDDGNYKENSIISEEERVLFDFERYFNDEEYKKSIKDYYNKIKHTVNIFALIDYIPHFKAMFEMLNVVNTIDSNISLKSLLNNYYMDLAVSRLRRVDDNTTNKINAAINTLLIQYYISEKGFLIPTKEGWELFDEDGSRVTSSGNSLILTTPETLKSFLFIFEQYIIPQLLNGTYFNSSVTLKDGTELTTEEINNLVKRNSFIRGLVSGHDNNIPMYLLDIDMLNIDKSPISNIKYLKYLNGFIDLHNIMIGNLSIADWFMIYNLVRNKNQFGRDRFTTLFNELIKDKKSNYILKDYLAYIGQKDYDKSIFNDIIENNSLEAILLATAKTVRTYSGQYDMFVKIYDESGEPKYYKNSSGIRGAYSETSNGISFIPNEEKLHRNLRIADNEEYGFGLLTSNFSNLILNKLHSNWATVVGHLIERGYIKIENKCD